MDNKVCPKCKTQVLEILQTGFVGCEKCYEIEEVKAALKKMYGDKRHKA